MLTRKQTLKASKPETICAASSSKVHSRARHSRANKSRASRPGAATSTHSRADWRNEYHWPRRNRDRRVQTKVSRMTKTMTMTTMRMSPWLTRPKRQKSLLHRKTLLRRPSSRKKPSRQRLLNLRELTSKLQRARPSRSCRPLPSASPLRAPGKLQASRCSLPASRVATSRTRPCARH